MSSSTYEKCLPTPSSSQSRGASEGLTRLSHELSHFEPHADRGKQPADDNQQRKRKQVIGEDDNEANYWEWGLMADARCVEHPDKFISINLDVDQQGRVAHIEDHFRRLPYRPCFPL